MLFWKKDKSQSHDESDNKKQELDDLDLENLNKHMEETQRAVKAEVDQYLEHDAKISQQTKAYLQNQQTKVLELDDLENLLNEHQSSHATKPLDTTVVEEKSNYQTEIEQQKEQLKFEFIDPLLKQPTTNEVLRETMPMIEEETQWDFEKLVPISEPKINLRVHKSQKRSLQ